MIGEFTRLVLTVFVLVLGAAAEELLPKFFGVGFPVLLAAVSPLLVRCTRAEGLAFAAAAGAMEEALSSLPPMSGVSFFLAVAVLARRCGFPGLVSGLAYPIYQIWLSVWFASIGGGVFGRVLLAFPIGFLTAVAVQAAMDWLCRKAALNEQG